MIGPLDAVAIPWVFSQSSPLDTGDLIKACKDRGLPADVDQLRRYYELGALVPFIEVTDLALEPPRAPGSAPRGGGSRVRALQLAVAEGRIRDLTTRDFQAAVRFDARRMDDPPGWWNGLLYSSWQMLGIPELRRLNAESGPGFGIPYALTRIASWVPVIAALEARYLPTIEREWLWVSGAEPNEWYDFMANFDPVVEREYLQVEPRECLEFAEWLLSRAHRIDPTGKWSELIRRAPRSSWRTLTGDALVAMDHRVAAEILLAFYEDLSSRGDASSLAPVDTLYWQPRADRISFQSEGHLDRLLSGLGISPHPGVVLVVEGETEQVLFPRVFDLFGWRRTPDLVQIICLRGADKNLAIVGAAIAAPIVGGRRGDSYDLIRPPTRILIVVDRDRRWSTPEKAEANRRKVVAEIARVVAGQGAKVDAKELDHLVVVSQWSATCFEFQHFTDAEIAEALLGLPGAPPDLQRPELIATVSRVREKGQDVKHVWDNSWRPQPRKPELADRLWPILSAKIEDARRESDLPMPMIAEAAYAAVQMAQRPQAGTFSLKALL